MELAALLALLGTGAITLILLVVLAVVVIVSLAASFLPLVAFLALVPGMIEATNKRRAARLALWAEIAEALGGGMDDEAVRATVDGRPLRVATRVVSTGESTQTYTDVTVGGVLPGLALEPQGLFSGLFGGKDHEVGDPSFDPRFVVGGDEDALGALSHEVRAALAASRFALRLHEGTLRVTASGAVADREALQAQITEALTLARMLSVDGATMVSRLEDGVATDPAAAVRQRFLTLLWRRDPEAAVAAAKRALQDPEPSVRISAARGLRRGDVALRELATPDATEEVRIEAMEALFEPGDIEAGIAVAVAVPEAERLWRAAARKAAEAGTREAARALAALGSALQPPWPRARRGLRTVAAREVAEALGALPPDPAAEAALLSILSCEDPGTRSTAVQALGAVGSIAAVEPLKALVDQAGILSGFGGEARQAVRAIQARASGERGGVSLAQAAGGDLALAERRAAAARRQTEGG